MKVFDMDNDEQLSLPASEIIEILEKDFLLDKQWEIARVMKVNSDEVTIGINVK